MSDRDRDEITIENAKLIWTNFEGRPTQWTKDERYFHVIIPEEDVEEFVNRGYNVKIKEPKYEDQQPFHHLKVKVRFDNYPPLVKLYNGKAVSLLDEDTVKELDYAEFKEVEVTFGPSHWNVNGKSGVSAYLRKLQVAIKEDAFMAKYGEEEAPFE